MKTEEQHQDYKAEGTQQGLLRNKFPHPCQNCFRISFEAHF